MRRVESLDATYVADMSEYEIEAPHLTPLQQANVDRLPNPKRRMERVLVYALVNNYVGYGLLIDHLPSGEPILTDRYGNRKELWFTISHCRSGAAISVSNESRTGVDIEDPTERLNRIIPKFLSGQEAEILSTDQLRLAAWTIKEAAFKAAGIDDVTLGEIRIDLLSGENMTWDINVRGARLTGQTVIEQPSGRAISRATLIQPPAIP